MKNILKILNKKHRKDFKQINNSIDYDQYAAEMICKKRQKKHLIWMMPSLLTCLCLAIIIPITMNRQSNPSISSSEQPIPIGPSNPSNQPLNRVITPNNEKVSNEVKGMDELSYNSYMTFTKNFGSFTFETHTLKNGDKSLGISIVDAYINFAIIAIISEENVQKEFLTFMGLDSIDDLKIACKDIIASLGTLYADELGSLAGGANLNSIWLDPSEVALLDNKEQLHQDLANIFDVSVYLENLTEIKANQYLLDNGLKDLPTPEIKLDGESPAIAVMSVFYCLDSYTDEKKEIFENEYKNGTKEMIYKFDNQEKLVKYLTTENNNILYEGEDFIATATNIRNLSLSYYLPEEDVRPISILDDVLNKNYGIKNRIDEFGNSTSYYPMKVNQPYFKLENKIDFDKKDLIKHFPTSIEHGFSTNLVRSLTGDNISLDFITQQSIMSFDYNGFYSCSVTISGGDTEIAQDKYPIFNLDHPYIFTVNKPDVSIGNDFQDIPLIVGQIIDPNYV